MVGDVQPEQPPTDMPRHESVVRHPIRATEEEAAHLREVAQKGESPATPAILLGVVAGFIAPLVAIVIVLAFAVAYFA
jgi:hypothetical protein